MAGPIFGKYTSSPGALSEGGKRVARASKTGSLIVARDVDTINFTPVLDTSQYADNDVLFISTEITNFFRVAGGRTRLVSATMFDGDDQGTEVTIFFTTSATTPGTINGAISGADSVMDDIEAYVQFTAFEDLINSQVSNVGAIDKIIEGSTTSIYCWGAVRSGTPTYTASGLKFKFGVEYLD